MSSSIDWAGLFRAESPKLLRFLRQFEPAVSAEEVAQDSFVRLLSASPEHFISPRALLFRTARNIAIDQIRRGRASPVRFTPNIDDIAAPAALANPEAAHIALEARRAMEAAINALRDDERQALTLRKLEGLSPEAIGARLGVSPRQVQRLIVQALEKCRARVRAGEDKSASSG
jgi:RNA polymerase sigma-70 factor (ECF subfamily)